VRLEYQGVPFSHFQHALCYPERDIDILNLDLAEMDKRGGKAPSLEWLEAATREIVLQIPPDNFIADPSDDNPGGEYELPEPEGGILSEAEIGEVESGRLLLTHAKRLLSTAKIAITRLITLLNENKATARRLERAIALLDEILQDFG
jgi:hypothetical protein